MFHTQVPNGFTTPTQCEGNGSGLLKDSVMQRNPFLKLYTNDCLRHYELITDEKVFISTINRR